MATVQTEFGSFHLPAILARERSRLVGLCAVLTGEAGVAEDLAQETLYEAWKHQASLLDRERCVEWLSGIARNVCRRWRQREGRAREVPLPDDAEGAETFVDDLDVEAELEHGELASLLDRALALLPAQTRAVLVGRYIEEAAHAEIAGRLGLSEGAVKVRLHRGKLALRRLLRTDLKDCAAAYGLAPPGHDGWDSTPIWCTYCGTRRLIGRLHHQPSNGEFALRCTACLAARGLVYHQSDATLLGGVSRYKPALSRIAAWANGYFRRAVREGVVPCRACGGPSRLRRAPDARSVTLHVECAACGLANLQSCEGLVLALPESQAFWRAHPRLRTLPPREVEAEGRLALVTTFESLLDGARLDVLSARDTLDVLRLYPDARA